MVNKKSSPMRTAVRNQIKKLRSDARKLYAIAGHLRQQAKDLAEGLKADERAEQAQANFYSKPAKVDPSIILTPDIPAVCSIQHLRSWPGCYEDCGSAGTSDCPHHKPAALFKTVQNAPK